jgi:hypothetical protein
MPKKSTRIVPLRKPLHDKKEYDDAMGQSCTGRYHQKQVSRLSPLTFRPWGIDYDELFVKLNLRDDEILQLFHFFQTIDILGSQQIFVNEIFQKCGIETIPLLLLQILALWDQNRRIFDFPFFVCSIWNFLTWSDEDVYCHIFSLYKHPRFPLLLPIANISSLFCDIHGINYSENRVLSEIEKQISLTDITFDMFSDYCAKHSLLIGPILAHQHSLRESICGVSFWLAIGRRRETTPELNGENFIDKIELMYSTISFYKALAGRLLILHGERQFTCARQVNPTTTPVTNDDDLDSRPEHIIRSKPSSRTVSRTGSFSGGSSSVVISIESPCSAAEIVLHGDLYDSDGDTISVASITKSVGSGKCSECGGSVLAERWAVKQIGVQLLNQWVDDWNPDDLETPRSGEGNQLESIPPREAPVSLLSLSQFSMGSQEVEWNSETLETPRSGGVSPL